MLTEENYKFSIISLYLNTFYVKYCLEKNLTLFWDNFLSKQNCITTSYFYCILCDKKCLPMIFWEKTKLTLLNIPRPFPQFF